jgi:uncharacterized damage-inducible protein DinB
VLAHQIRTFARYDRWADARLAATVAALDEGAYRADLGLVFRSIHGTLNHLLVADRIWLHRMTGERDDGLPDRLDAILVDDRGALAAAREREDGRIIAFADRLDEAALAGICSYRTRTGEAYAQPLAAVLAHLFNHQTHHRGQMHAALTGLGQTAPALDLIYYLREVG